MNWFESIIYGFVSGFSGILPISFRAHQDIMLVLFGVEEHDPIRNIFVLIAIVFALFQGCRTFIDQIRRENSVRLHKHTVNDRSTRQYDLRLVKNAVLPMLLGALILSYLAREGVALLWVALFLLINGVILFIPTRVIRTNRDARTMSFFDSILMGLSCALSAIPGFSAIGCTSSAAIGRGADSKKALDWALLLAIPAFILLAAINFVGIFSFLATHVIWGNIFGYILSALFAYIGSYLGIMLMRFIAQRNSFSDFAYYCWGAALLTFILFLIVV